MRPLLFFLFLIVTYSWAFSQTRTVISATCGSCKKPVPASSKTGDRCPHCGVRWGYENNLQSEESSYKFENSFGINSNSSTNLFRSIGKSMTIKVANLRSAPTTKSTVIAQLPINSSIYIKEALGDWVKIDYYGFTQQYVSDLAFYKQLCDNDPKFPSLSLSPVVMLDSPCRKYENLLYSQSPKSWVGWLHKSNVVQ